MPSDGISVAPESTGPALHTRSRTIGGEIRHEQYVIALPHERVAVARAYVASFRQFSRAVATQPIFTLWNGGTNLVAVRRLTLEADQNPVATNNTGAAWARTYRITAAPTGGTALTKVQQDTNETTSAAVVATGDMASDTAVAATALAFTANPTSALWQQTLVKWHGTAGVYSPPTLNMLPDDAELQQEDPLILRPNQGVGIRVEHQANMAAQTTAGVAGAFYFYAKCAFAEVTLP